jgi:hypothetical protein
MAVNWSGRVSIGASCVAFGAVLGFVAATVAAPFAALFGAIGGAFIGVCMAPIISLSFSPRSEELRHLATAYIITLAAGLIAGTSGDILLATVVPVVALVLCAACHFRISQTRRGNALGSCDDCGYDLTGNVSGVCPECGTPTTHAHTIVRKNSLKRCLGALTVVFPLAAVGWLAVDRLMIGFGRDALIQKLAHDDMSVVDRATNKLRRFGDAPFIDALNSPNPRIRRKAARALIGTQDSDAADPLLAALQDADAHVRMWAARAIGGLSDERAICPLFRLMQDRMVRNNAAHSLALLGVDVDAGADAYGCPAD